MSRRTHALGICPDLLSALTKLICCTKSDLASCVEKLTKRRQTLLRSGANVAERIRHACQNKSVFILDQEMLREWMNGHASTHAHGTQCFRSRGPHIIFRIVEGMNELGNGRYCLRPHSLQPDRRHAPHLPTPIPQRLRQHLYSHPPRRHPHLPNRPHRRLSPLPLVLRRRFRQLCRRSCSFPSKTPQRSRRLYPLPLLPILQLLFIKRQRPSSKLRTRPRLPRRRLPPRLRRLLRRLFLRLHLLQHQLLHPEVIPRRPRVLPLHTNVTVCRPFFRWNIPSVRSRATYNSVRY